MQINYTIVDSSLGRLLVAATDRGICAVSFADEDARLESFLESEYPAANIQREDGLLKKWVSAILEYLDGSQPHLDLPLDVQATAFQLRVWEELRKIPYGETRTYLQVANAIGQPEAVRAVGHACATNPAALVTPCHRVVRTDGGMGGYRWGLERKQALLAKEQRQKQLEDR
jgi:AraC family transcriptional regulator of adaptative response/methylated-DNA-[protein]-cysteine methyltransferase